MKCLLFFVLLVLVASSNTEAKTKREPITNSKGKSVPAVLETAEKKTISWTFDKVVGKTLVFKGGQKFETGLFELKYIGKVSVDEDAPFLIYSGRDCDECDANISLYFHSPRNGKLDVEHGKNRFAHPGKVSDYLTNDLVYESSAYYGEILTDMYGIIWFEKSLSEINSFSTSITLAKILNGKIEIVELKDQNSLQQTLTLKTAGKNKEIPPMEFTSEP